MDEIETDADLLARHKLVEEMVGQRRRQMERLPMGHNRSTKAQFLGCLNFTLLTIESEIRDRGLTSQAGIRP